MKNFDAFIRHLEAMLNKPLPGERAHLLMAPAEREHLMRQPGADQNVREAAVLMLFHPVNNEPSLVFIVRQQYDGVHSGQISFPGGKREAGDPDLIYTAIRETSEETGIMPASVHVLGTASSLFIPPSKFLVTPVIGYTGFIQDFIPQETEVREVLSIPFSHISNGSNRKLSLVNASYRQNMEVPCFMVNGITIWGATAMMLSELVEIVNGTAIE